MTSDEQWLPIPGWDHYEASSLGRIRSLDRTVTRRGDGATSTWPGKVLKPKTTSTGYRAVRPFQDGTGRHVTIHRLVLMAFQGLPVEGQEARHLNGDRTDNRPENLAWSDHSTNMRDRVAHGTDQHAMRTHCPQGHPYDDENTYLHDKGNGRLHRHCKTCQRASLRRFYENRKAAR